MGESPPRPTEILNITPKVDLCAELERTIKQKLTPDEQRRLVSSIQGVSVPSLPKNQQTPIQSTDSTSVHSLSTPMFRLATPIRPYTNPIQQKSPFRSPSQIKRPLPVYAPMTPTQIIKDTAFRSSAKRRTGTSSSSRVHRRRSSKLFASNESFGNGEFFLQSSTSEDAEFNEVC